MYLFDFLGECDVFGNGVRGPVHAGPGHPGAGRTVAHELAPDVAAIADTYGWILVQSGDVGGGLAVLKQAVSGATPQPDIRYHYAAALAKAGQRDAARAELVELMRTKEQYSASADARKLLAELGGE